MSFEFKPIALALVIAGVMSTPLAVFADGGVFSDGGTSDDAISQAQLTALGDRLSQLEARQSSTISFKGPRAVQVQRGSAQTDYLLNDGRAVGQEIFLLKSKANNRVSDPVIYLGANVRGQSSYLRETNASTSSDYTQSVSLHRAAVGFLSTFNDSMTGFIDVTNQTPAVEHAYVLWGDLKQHPYYVLIGKNDVNFGSFERFGLGTDPQTKVWFAPSQRAQFSVGYIGDNVDLAISVFGGEPMYTVEGTPTVTSDSSRTVLPKTSTRIGNVALNGGYHFDVAGVKSKVGLGLLAGSAYVTTRNGTNPAADVYADVAMGRLSLHGEYVRTLHGSGSDLVANTLNGSTTIATRSENAIVDAWSIDTAYAFQVQGYNTRATLGLSKFAPSKHAHIDQFVLGYNVGLGKGLDTGIEYTYSSTYGTAGTELYNCAQIAAVMSVFF
jgi:hypothetical protein